MIEVLIQVEACSCERHLFNETTLEYKGSRQISQHFPYPYGFILGTSADDGDGVDCFIITKDPLQAKSIVPCDPIGLLEQDEEGEMDHKVLAALPGQHVELNESLLEELRNFIYGMWASFPDAHIEIGQLLPRQAALGHIQKFQNK